MALIGRLTDLVMGDSDLVRRSKVDYKPDFSDLEKVKKEEEERIKKEYLEREEEARLEKAQKLEEKRKKSQKPTVLSFSELLEKEEKQLLKRDRSHLESYKTVKDEDIMASTPSVPVTVRPEDQEEASSEPALVLDEEVEGEALPESEESLPVVKEELLEVEEALSKEPCLEPSTEPEEEDFYEVSYTDFLKLEESPYDSEAYTKASVEALLQHLLESSRGRATEAGKKATVPPVEPTAGQVLFDQESISRALGLRDS